MKKIVALVVLMAVAGVSGAEAQQLTADYNGDTGVSVFDFSTFAAKLDTPIAGDYSGDGVVDASDYAVWQRAQNTEQGGGGVFNDGPASYQRR